MARLKIICDASLDQAMGVGAYSGFIEIQDGENSVKEIFNGAKIGTKNTAMLESLAIERGLKTLMEHMNTLSTPVESLDVYSDSASITGKINESLGVSESTGRSPSRVVKSIARIIKSEMSGATVNIHHVKAHVPDEEANEIEKQHNEVDRNAVAYRNMMEKGFAKSNLNRGRRAVVLLPDTFSYGEAKDYHAMAFQLSVLGFSFTVVGGPQNESINPFLRGLQDFRERYLDGEIYHQHIQSLDDIKSAMLTNKKPYEWMLDLSSSEDKSVMKKTWMGILEKTGISFTTISGFDNANTHFGLHKGNHGKGILPELREQVLDILTRYQDVATPDQMILKVKEELNEMGVSVNERLSSELTLVAQESRGQIFGLTNGIVKAVLHEQQVADIEQQNLIVENPEGPKPAVEEKPITQRKIA